MATFAQTIALYQKTASLVKDNINQLTAINAEIAAINPKDPNAAQQLANLQAKFDATLAANSAKIREAVAAEQAAYNTLNAIDQLAVRNDPAAAREVTSLTAVKDANKKLVAEKKTAIAANNPPPPAPAPTPTAGTATTATPAAAPAAGNTAPNTNTLSGAADGDSGQKQPNAANTNGTPSKPAGTATTPSAGSSGQADPARTDGATTQSDKGTGADPQSSTPNQYPNETFSAQQPMVMKPGRRLENPLGYLSSYTYQISLYMITPDAYEAFVASGRKDISVFQNTVSSSDVAQRNASLNQAGARKGGAFLIAQSGGITTPGEQRAPGFDFDYGIDNLTFKHVVDAKESQSPVVNTDFTFQIIEPYGFSFISKLRDAQNEMVKYAGGKSNVPTNPSRQFYILGIRFYGYDANGRPVKGSSMFNGKVLDPSSTGEALFETYYDICFTSVKTKLDGKSTTYTISAAQLANANSVNLKKGMLYTGKQVTGYTVRDALLGEDGLLTKLNKEQVDMKTNKTIKNPITYKIEWVGEAKEIAFAPIVSEAKPDKGAQAGGSAKNTEQSNAATETKSTPNSNTRTITLPDNWPIIQCMDQIISRSQWLEDRLKVTYTDKPEYDPKTKAPEEVKPTQSPPIAWFNVSPKINNIKWDSTLNDWAFDITYQIQTYRMPVVDSPYAKSTMPYYGPSKRYDYWYTGQNKEIISYEQTLDNLYFNAAVAGSPQDEKSTGTGNAAENKNEGGTTAPIKAGDGFDSGGGLGSAAASSFRTSLYDPASYANAKVTILGDPDFLIQDTAQSINGVFDRHYGSTGFNINATGGQVFFEIDFKEAIDYSSSSVTTDYSSARGGTLSINDSIEFWRYPDSVKQLDENGEPIIKGISYRLLFVRSTFQNGGFKQLLEATINTLNPNEAAESKEQRESNTSDQNADSGQTPAGTPTDPKQPESTPTNNNQQPAPAAPQSGPTTSPPQDDQKG